MSSMDWGWIYVKTKKISLFRSQIWHSQVTVDWGTPIPTPSKRRRKNMVPWQKDPFSTHFEMVELIHIWYGINPQTLLSLFPSHSNTFSYSMRLYSHEFKKYLVRLLDCFQVKVVYFECSRLYIADCTLKEPIIFLFSLRLKVLLKWWSTVKKSMFYVK